MRNRILQKRFIQLFLCCMIFFGTASLLYAANGTLKVTSFPTGAEVWVDGSNTGKVTPMSIALAEGDHEVTVQIPDSGWNPDTRTVTIVPGNNDLSVTLLPSVTQGPPGADGSDGLHCWDLNGNGQCDLSTEDITGDSLCDASDCQGPRGDQGQTGAQGPAGADGSSCSATQGSGSATVNCTDGTSATVYDGAQGPPGESDCPITLEEFNALLARVATLELALFPTFERTFGGTSEVGYSVQQTTDGGYIIAGTSLLSVTPGVRQEGVYLIKTDANGNADWEQTFVGTGNGEGYSVQQTTDGGYVIAGYTDSFGAGDNDVYLIKTDRSGNLLWEMTYGGKNHDYGYSVQETADGGYIIAGYTASYGAGGTDVYLIKTDANGNAVWEQTYGGPSDDLGYSVQETADGGYIIAGTSLTSGGTDDQVYLIKTHSDGKPDWEVFFGGKGRDFGYTVQQTTDGGYIIAGVTDSFGTGNEDAYLIKTDEFGNLLWERNYGSTTRSFAYSVEQTSDGGYIIAGEIEEEVYLVKTDATGTLDWENTFGGTGRDIGYSVQQTSDGGYIITGLTTNMDGASGVYLIKTNSNGNVQ